MLGWSDAGRVSSQYPSHQSASWPMPVTQHLSIAPTNDASQRALNSINAKCRPGYRPGTPPAPRAPRGGWGTAVLRPGCGIVRFGAGLSVIGLVAIAAGAS